MSRESLIHLHNLLGNAFFVDTLRSNLPFASRVWLLAHELRELYDISVTPHGCVFSVRGDKDVVWPAVLTVSVNNQQHGSPNYVLQSRFGGVLVQIFEEGTDDRAELGDDCTETRVRFVTEDRVLLG